MFYLASLGSQLFVGLRHPIGLSGKTVDLEQRGSRFRMSVKTPHQTRIHVSPSLNTIELELELELIQTQMAQKPMLRAEVGMRVRCANKASAE